MKFSGKMCLKIILKVTKTKVSPFLQKIHFSKSHRGGDQIVPPPPPPSAVLGLNLYPLKVEVLISVRENDFCDTLFD